MLENIVTLDYLSDAKFKMIPESGHGGRRNGAGRPRKSPKPAPAAVKPVAARGKLLEPPNFQAVDGGAGVPPEPDWSIHFADELDIAVAHEQWGVLVRELRDTEKLASANAHQIKRLCVSYVLFEVSLRHVAEDGAVFPRKGKKQPSYNPWFTVLKDANSMALVAEAELTITPRRRSNGGKVQRKKPSQIGGGYLKSLPK